MSHLRRIKLDSGETLIVKEYYLSPTIEGCGSVDCGREQMDVMLRRLGQDVHCL
jgi:hypothetical protein